MAARKTKVSTTEDTKKKTTSSTTKSSTRKKKTEEVSVVEEAPKKTTTKKSYTKKTKVEEPVTSVTEGESIEVKAREIPADEPVTSGYVEEVKETPVEEKTEEGVPIKVGNALERKVSDLNFTYHDHYGRLPNELRLEFPDRITDMFIPYSMIFNHSQEKFAALVAGGNYYCYCKYDQSAQSPSDNYEIIKAYMNFCIEHCVRTHVVIVDELFTDANSSIAIDLSKILLHKFRFAFTDIIATNDINKIINAYDFSSTGGASVAGYIPIRNNNGQVLEIFVGYSIGFKE